MDNTTNALLPRTQSMAQVQPSRGAQWWTASRVRPINSLAFNGRSAALKRRMVNPGPNSLLERLSSEQNALGLNTNQPESTVMVRGSISGMVMGGEYTSAQQPVQQPTSLCRRPNALTLSLTQNAIIPVPSQGVMEQPGQQRTVLQFQGPSNDVCHNPQVVVDIGQTPLLQLPIDLQPPVLELTDSIRPPKVRKLCQEVQPVTNIPRSFPWKRKDFHINRPTLGLNEEVSRRKLVLDGEEPRDTIVFKVEVDMMARMVGKWVRHLVFMKRKLGITCRQDRLDDKYCFLHLEGPEASIKTAKKQCLKRVKTGVEIIPIDAIKGHLPSDEITVKYFYMPWMHGRVSGKRGHYLKDIRAQNVKVLSNAQDQGIKFIAIKGLPRSVRRAQLWIQNERHSGLFVVIPDLVKVRTVKGIDTAQPSHR